MREYSKNEDKTSTVKDIKTRFVNELMHDINMQFSHEIKDHHILKKIVDSFFGETQKFFVTMGFIHIFFNFIPFILQVFNDLINRNLTGIVICNSLCIFTSFLFLILEIVVLKSAGSIKLYLSKSIFNFIDIPMCIIQIFYSVHRIWDPEHEVLPEIYSEDLKVKNVEMVAII